MRFDISIETDSDGIADHFTDLAAVLRAIASEGVKIVSVEEAPKAMTNPESVCRESVRDFV